METTSKKEAFREKSSTLVSEEKPSYLENKRKAFQKVYLGGDSRRNTVAGFQEWQSLDKEKIAAEENRLHLVFKQKIYKAKIEGKTVSIVDGNLVIDYKMAGRVPDGFEL